MINSGPSVDVGVRVRRRSGRAEGERIQCDLLFVSLSFLSLHFLKFVSFFQPVNVMNPDFVLW